jgi:hypothetical protein
MIVNAYTVLDGFTTFLRFLFGLAVVGLAIAALWRCRSSISPEGRKDLEDRSYLLFLVAIVLLILNLASWPLLYLLLQSYVSEWPEVMCIYGVTQIGAGSEGVSRFLPGLLALLQATKPALVFMTGGWLVLYALNRRTATAPLLRRVLLVVVAVGVFAVLDAAAEGAYLVIPKQEERVSRGCCTMTLDSLAGEARGLWGELGDGENKSWLSGVYYGVNGAMCMALGAYLTCLCRRGRSLPLAPLVVGSLASVPATLIFVVDIAAPALLHLPNHHCPYDLIPGVPESVVAGALFVLGFFSVGWAALAASLGRCAETEPFLRQTRVRLLGLGLIGYAGSLVMFSLEVALA